MAQMTMYLPTSVPLQTDFTIEASFKASSTAFGFRTIVIWQKNAPNHETSLAINPSGGIRLGQFDYQNFSWQELNGSTFVRDDEWHQVAAVKSGNQWTLYVDGNVDGTLTLASNNHAAENLTDFRIGAIKLNNGNLAEYFKGSIDEVRIWDYARCQDEILAQKDCELAGTETDLYAYYQFNEGDDGGNNASVTTLPDISGNGYDAALNNFALTGTTSNWIAPGVVATGTSCGTPGSCNAPPVAVCQNITVDADGNCEGSATAEDFDGGSTDPDGDPLTFSVDVAGPYALGTTTVTLTVEDPSGETDDCAATITVEDNEDPTITCPVSVTVDADAGVCEATGVALGTASATDNCASITPTNDAPASYALGANTVTWTADDGNGQSVTCEQTVTVEDNEDPAHLLPSQCFGRHGRRCL